MFPVSSGRLQLCRVQRRCVAALNGIRRRAVRPASHTRVAHKDFDFPADEWLRRRLTDISRDSVAVCYRKVSRRSVRASFALWTSL